MSGTIDVIDPDRPKHIVTVIFNLAVSTGWIDSTE